MPHPVLTFSSVDLLWPDGTVALDALDLTVGPGRHGLVGLNGAGKSTLLRLAAGELAPTRGTVVVDGDVGYLPQQVTTDPGRRVADVLGIGATLDALAAIEAGSTSPRDFDVVGDDWDVRERARAHLDRLGLDRLDVDRAVGTLSGGESTLLHLTALLLRRPSLLLLDEPTTHLDTTARSRVEEVVRTWPGTLLVASHDRRLLNLVDDIAELHDHAVRWFGGGFDDYAAAVEAEQEAVRRDVRDAKADVRRQERDLVAAQTALDRRARTARKAEREKRVPKIVAHGRRMSAQVSAGKYRTDHEQDVAAARQQLDDAERRLRDDREIRLELPRSAVPASREVVTTEDLRLRHVGTAVDLHLRGPEHVAVVGPNGSGKTTLVRTLLGLEAPASGRARVHVPVAHLPQGADLLDPDLDLVANVRRHAPDTPQQEVRAQLARLLFRGREAEQPAATLSGGERLRANLACLLLADPAPQLLVLDEPTNHLDLASVRHLVEAVRAFPGAVLVVSHDADFLDRIGLDRRIDLGTDQRGVRRG